MSSDLDFVWVFVFHSEFSGFLSQNLDFEIFFGLGSRCHVLFGCRWDVDVVFYLYWSLDIVVLCGSRTMFSLEKLTKNFNEIHKAIQIYALAYCIMYQFLRIHTSSLINNENFFE